MRALVQFGKTKRLRFVSHLDLQRTMQMALRRTDLPVAYSQGFNPHPLIAFASALAVSHTSEAEVLDIRLAADVSASFVLGQMRGALPPGLPVMNVTTVDDRERAMMALVTAADYEIEVVGAPLDPPARAFLEKNEVFAMRKTKSGERICDIRPMVHGMTVSQTDGKQTVSVRLSLTEKATLKPDLLMSVLAEGLDVRDISVHRKMLLKTIEEGYVPLLEGFL